MRVKKKNEHDEKRYDECSNPHAPAPRPASRTGFSLDPESDGDGRDSHTREEFDELGSGRQSHPYRRMPKHGERVSGESDGDGKDRSHLRTEEKALLVE